MTQRNRPTTARRLLGAAGATALALLATPAAAGVGYDVEIEAPAAEDGRAVVRGDLLVQARAEGGVGDAAFAAYDVRTAGAPWSEAGRVPMEQVEPGRFFGRLRWPSARYANGEYLLEVRIWGEVPAYDRDNPGTFARATVELLVDNPPERPIVRAKIGAGSVRLSWRRTRSAEREDFYGYRVWVVPGRRCPRDPEAYALAAEATTTTWGAVGLRPGPYCYRVTSARRSPVTGIVDSSFSPPLRLSIPSLASGAEVVDAPQVVAPVARADQPEVKTKRKEGRFAETLPYDTPQMPSGRATPGAVSLADEGPARTSGEETAHRAAGGLLLLAIAIHLRRVLRAPAPGRR